ncbi:MAG: hypothetical protein ACYCW6_06805 [Candidatus Xenobia bacterium]
MRITPAYLPYQPPPSEPPADPSLHLSPPSLPVRPLNLHYDRYHELQPDDPLWTEPKDELRQQGLRRVDTPDGQQLQGLKVDGMPVTYEKKPQQYVWTLRVRDTAHLLAANAPDPNGPPSQQGDTYQEWTSPTGSTTIFSLPGGDLTPPGRPGGEIGVNLEAGPIDGVVSPSIPARPRQLPVYSQKPLEPEVLKTMASALAEVPPVALRGVQALYVAERVGEGDVDGEAHPVGAVTVDTIPTIVFDHQSLRDPGWGRTVILHEVGHLVDGLASQESVSDVDPAFQEGRKFTDRHHAPDMPHDDFISWYACISPAEDFAETHALVLEARTAFNKANPGHDLLAESPAVAGAWLSPVLADKAAAVVRRYQQLAQAS